MTCVSAWGVFFTNSERSWWYQNQPQNPSQVVSMLTTLKRAGNSDSQIGGQNLEKKQNFWIKFIVPSYHRRSLLACSHGVWMSRNVRNMFLATPPAHKTWYGTIRALGNQLNLEGNRQNILIFTKILIFKLKLDPNSGFSSTFVTLTFCWLDKKVKFLKIRRDWSLISPNLQEF